MVRLADNSLLQEELAYVFQFQHGSIGSIDGWNSGAVSDRFQFQHGSIGRFGRPSVLKLAKQFQFQHGSIGSLYGGTEAMYPFGYFNSSMVRLAERIVWYHRKFFLNFNSSMVRLAAYPDE